MKKRQLTFHLDDGTESVKVTVPAHRITQTHKDVLGLLVNIYFTLCMSESYDGSALPEDMRRRNRELLLAYDQEQARRNRAHALKALEDGGQQRLAGT